MESKVIALVGLALLVPAAARADVANDYHSSGADLAWVEYHNATADFHKAQRNALEADHRLISLSLAGSATNPRYAAVWVKATAPDQHIMTIVNGAGDPCCTFSRFLAKRTDEQVLGYYPVLVTAVGTDEAGAKLAAVFEKTAHPTTVAVAYSTAGFTTLSNTEHGTGQMLRSISIFGTSAAPIYYGIYEALTIPGSNAVPAWASSIGVSSSDFFTREAAYDKEWVRPGALAGAKDGTFTAAWYDALLTSSLADVQTSSFPDVDAASLDALITIYDFTADMLPMQVQAVKRGGALHYSVLFADSASIVADPDRRIFGLPRTFASNGSPDLAADPLLQPFETNLKQFMLDKNVRAATLAIGWKGRLVFARAYTWAEIAGGYPTTTPTQLFRVGSVSKVFAMIAAYVLDGDGVLSLDDALIDDLDSPPTPSDSRFDDITLRDLAAHRSGLTRKAPQPSVVASSMFGSGTLPETRADVTDFTVATTTLPNDPGEKFLYSNLAYLFLGEALAGSFGDTFDAVVDATLSAVLYPAGSYPPRASESRFEDQTALEPRYHTLALGLVPSQVEDGQPLVPAQYGATDMSIAMSAGGFAASAPQVVKLMALLRLPAGVSNPVLTADQLHNAAGNGILDLLTVDSSPTANPTKTMGGLNRATKINAPTCLIPTGVTSYDKPGSIAGARATAVVRTDTLTIAVMVTGDTPVSACTLNQWASGIAFSSIPTTTDYYATYDVLPF